MLLGVIRNLPVVPPATPPKEKRGERKKKEGKRKPSFKVSAR